MTKMEIWHQSIVELEEGKARLKSQSRRLRARGAARDPTVHTPACAGTPSWLPSA